MFDITSVGFLCFAVRASNYRLAPQVYLIEVGRGAFFCFCVLIMVVAWYVLKEDTNRYKKTLSGSINLFQQ